MSTEIAAPLSPGLDSGRKTRGDKRPGAGLSLPYPALAAGLLLLGLAWYVREWQPYTPASDAGYWMGVAGGSLMGALLLYPLRKRMRWTGVFGPLRHWFRFHMVAGIGGPLLVLYHSTFHVGSFNAAIALGSMLLVAASGIVGRFLYRRIHHGLYGRQATLKELQDALAEKLDALDKDLTTLPAIRNEIGRYLEESAGTGAAERGVLGRILTLGIRRRQTLRRIGRMIPEQRDTRRVIGETLAAAQQAFQFNAFVKLFALWHVIHIPFLGMLVLTAIAHVVAVHAY